MITKIKEREKNKTTTVVALIFYVWVFLIIYAIQTKPPIISDSKGWLLMMKSDFAGMLTLGGKVVNRDENVTFRAGLLWVEISDEGWSQLLLKEYQSYLVGQGWRRNYFSPLTYCKRGALATFFPQSGMRDKIGINYISMEYNFNSKKTCEQMGTEVKK